jgi:hypothetical protein
MAADQFNSLGGFSAGIPTIIVVDNTGNVVSNFNNLDGNVSANNVYATNYYYSNGDSVTNVIGSGSGTTTNIQVGSVGVGTVASGILGEIRATDNITSFFTSDSIFKENIKPVDGALEKILLIGSKTFNWTDEYISNRGGIDDYFVNKNDFGVIAQDVQKVFPLAVRERPDGTLGVDYTKLGILSFQAIIELKDLVDQLSSQVSALVTGKKDSD